jgi:uncharacterized membrane protein
MASCDMEVISTGVAVVVSVLSSEKKVKLSAGLKMTGGRGFSLCPWGRLVGFASFRLMLTMAGSWKAPGMVAAAETVDNGAVDIAGGSSGSTM